MAATVKIEAITMGNRLFMENLYDRDYVASLAEAFSNYLTATKLAMEDTLTNKQELTQNASLMRISSFHLVTQRIRYLSFYRFSIRAVCKLMGTKLKKLVSVP